jgi:hypothetical protein
LQIDAAAEAEACLATGDAQGYFGLPDIRIKAEPQQQRIKPPLTPEMQTQIERSRVAALGRRAAGLQKRKQELPPSLQQQWPQKKRKQ